MSPNVAVLQTVEADNRVVHIRSGRGALLASIPGQGLRRPGKSDKARFEPLPCAKGAAEMYSTAGSCPATGIRNNHRGLNRPLSIAAIRLAQTVDADKETVRITSTSVRIVRMSTAAYPLGTDGHTNICVSIKRTAYAGSARWLRSHDS
jgi:hypothetical protein